MADMLYWSSSLRRYFRNDLQVPWKTLYFPAFRRRSHTLSVASMQDVLNGDPRSVSMHAVMCLCHGNTLSHHAVFIFVCFVSIAGMLIVESEVNSHISIYKQCKSLESLSPLFCGEMTKMYLLH